MGSKDTRAAAGASTKSGNKSSGKVPATTDPETKSRWSTGSRTSSLPFSAPPETFWRWRHRSSPGPTASTSATRNGTNLRWTFRLRSLPPEWPRPKLPRPSWALLLTCALPVPAAAVLPGNPGLRVPFLNQGSNLTSCLRTMEATENFFAASSNFCFIQKLKKTKKFHLKKTRITKKWKTKTNVMFFELRNFVNVEHKRFNGRVLMAWSWNVTECDVQ